MELKIQFSKKSIENIVHITNFYEKQQIGLGSRFVSILQEQFKLIASMPNIARIGKVFGTRELVLHDFPYIVVYRVRNNHIQIATIYHQSRKYP